MPPIYIKTWIYFLLRANYQQFDGLGRGRFRTSYREISNDLTERMGCIERSPGEKTIARIISYFRKKKMIKTIAGDGILVEIINYDHYQDLVNYKDRKPKKDSGSNCFIRVPPLHVIIEYFQRNGGSEREAGIFYNHYKSTGKKYDDWEARVRLWIAKEKTPRL